MQVLHIDHQLAQCLVTQHQMLVTELKDIAFQLIRFRIRSGAKPDADLRLRAWPAGCRRSKMNRSYIGPLHGVFAGAVAEVDRAVIGRSDVAEELISG